MTRDGWDGDGEDRDLLEQLIDEETSKDPDFPQKLQDELQRQRQVRETREALATEPIVSLDDWRKSSDAEESAGILDRLRDQKADTSPPTG